MKINKACFKRQTLHVENALKTRGNEMSFRTIFCFKCVQLM